MDTTKDIKQLAERIAELSTMELSELCELIHKLSSETSGNLMLILESHVDY